MQQFRIFSSSTPEHVVCKEAAIKPPMSYFCTPTSRWDTGATSWDTSYTILHINFNRLTHLVCFRDRLIWRFNTQFEEGRQKAFRNIQFIEYQSKAWGWYPCRKIIKGQFFKKQKTNATWDEELSHSLWLRLYLKSYPILTQTSPPTPPASPPWLALLFLMHSKLVSSKSPSCKLTWSSEAGQQPKNRGEKVENQWRWGKQTVCARWQSRRLDAATQASLSRCSLLRGYIRNVKLHQTISAQHPHESGKRGWEGGDGVR